LLLFCKCIQIRAGLIHHGQSLAVLFHRDRGRQSPRIPLANQVAGITDDRIEISDETFQPFLLDRIVAGHFPDFGELARRAVGRHAI